jgi:hypothetical protein
MLNISNLTHPAIGPSLFSAVQHTAALINARISNAFKADQKTTATIAETASNTHIEPVYTSFFERIFTYVERKEAARREAYLAESTDIYDLEFRIARLDREGSCNQHWAISSPTRF